ncbi:hypothetical protein JCM21900_002925 [Sporobolomyces salmonicolor]
MPYLSNLQLLIAGGIFAYSGISLSSNPSTFLARIAPLTSLIERLTGLAAYKGGDEGLALAGLALMLLGYLHLMACYTHDEKMKRNSTPGRIIAATASFYICAQTSQGSSLIALFGIFNFVGGMLMGFSVGFEDGNQVDIEANEAEREKKRKRHDAELERRQQQQQRLQQAAEAKREREGGPLQEKVLSWRGGVQ